MCSTRQQRSHGDKDLQAASMVDPVEWEPTEAMTHSSGSQEIPPIPPTHTIPFLC